MGRVRADRLLVIRGHFESRTQAQAAIAAGLVRADGVHVRKPGQLLPEDSEIEAAAPHPYVSRGGLKLAAALTRFAVDPREKVCLDVGASTGGFTDMLSRAGARLVYAVDVGTDQLHPSLRARNNVVAMERADIRRLAPDRLAEPPALITIDVSFISLKLVLPAVSALAAPQAELIALIKPQFEAGRSALRKGVVRDPAIHAAVCEDIAEFVRGLGWVVEGVIESPVTGGDGNVEFLLCARRGALVRAAG